MALISLACMALLVMATPIHARKHFSFSTAKKRHEAYVYTDPDSDDPYQDDMNDYRWTFYCACNYDPDGEKTKDDDKVIDYESCNVLKGGEKRVKVEWEHVMPASFWLRRKEESDTKCWTDRKSFQKCKSPRGKYFSSRKCCHKVNKDYWRMEGDMYNLVPAVGFVNNDRSNYPYAEGIAKVVDSYKGCNFQVGDIGGVRYAEPLPPQEEGDFDVRGDIARINVYMSQEHDIPLTADEQDMFKRWAKLDPPDFWECEINRRIAAVQGNVNVFVNAPCKKLGRPFHDEL